MRAAVGILGTPAINLKTGKIMGQTDDLLFTSDGQLLGLILKRKYWFEKKPVLLRSNIQVIGEDYIFSMTSPCRWEKRECFKYVSFTKGPFKIKGHPVLTSTGKQLGVLENVYIDSNQEKIVGYEISDGFVSDLLEGRRIWSHTVPVQFTKDAVILPLP